MRTIDPDRLQSLFFRMLRIRRIEEAVAEEYAKQEMRCPTHFSIGQEAVAVGVCANLRQDDIAMSTHRSHAHFLAKGGSVSGMIAEFYGKSAGVAGGYGGSQHLIDRSVGFYGATPIVGSTIPVAVGTALAYYLQSQKSKVKSQKHNSKVKNNKNLQLTTHNSQPISVVFFGDAAVEEGVAHESMNFAALKKLPVLFVCENNQYSTYTHIRLRQPPRPVYRLAQAHGMAAAAYDGNDVIQVYQTSKTVIDAIREGNGPAFLEYATYRYREHVGPNYDAAGYRPDGELNRWQKKDAVERMRRYVIAHKLLNNRAIKQLEQKIQQEINEAFRFATESPWPEERLLEEMAYAKQVKSQKLKVKITSKNSKVFSSLFTFELCF